MEILSKSESENVRKELGLPAKEKSYFSQVGSNIVESVKNRGKQLFEAQKSGLNPANFQRSQLRAGGAIAGFVDDIAAAPVAPLLEKGLKTETGQKVMGAVQPVVQPAIDKYQGFKSKYPEIAKDVEAGANIASLLPIGKGAQILGRGAKAGTRGVVGTAGKVATRAGSMIDDVTKSGIGKTIKGVMPTRGGIIERQVANAFELTPRDLDNIKNISGNQVGNWVVKNNLIDADLESTVKRINDFSDTNYKTVREEIGKVNKNYTQDNIPRYKESLEELLKQNEGVPGLQKQTAEIKSLYSKQNPTLADAQRVKELMDDNFNLYKVTGDPSVGRAKEGLRNIRKDLKEFIEKEVKETTGTDIRPLNNNVQTAQAILKSQQGRSVRSFTRQELSLGDFGAFGSGTVIGGGNPLVGVAAVFFKKLATSPDVRLRVAKFFNKAKPKVQNKILNQLEEGQLPKEFEQFVSKKGLVDKAKEAYKNSPMSDEGGFVRLFESPKKAELGKKLNEYNKLKTEGKTASIRSNAEKMYKKTLDEYKKTK